MIVIVQSCYSEHCFDDLSSDNRVIIASSTTEQKCSYEYFIGAFSDANGEVLSIYTYVDSNGDSNGFVSIWESFPYTQRESFENSKGTEYEAEPQISDNYYIAHCTYLGQYQRSDEYEI